MEKLERKAAKQEAKAKRLAKLPKGIDQPAVRPPPGDGTFSWEDLRNPQVFARVRQTLQPVAVRRVINSNNFMITIPRNWAKALVISQDTRVRLELDVAVDTLANLKKITIEFLR